VHYHKELYGCRNHIDNIGRSKKYLSRPPPTSLVTTFPVVDISHANGDFDLIRIYNGAVMCT